MDPELQQASEQLDAPLLSPIHAAETVSDAGPCKIGTRLEAALRNWERAFEAHDRAFWIVMRRLNERSLLIEERVAKLESK